jgi:hypothetical protein
MSEPKKPTAAELWEALGHAYIAAIATTDNDATIADEFVAHFGAALAQGCDRWYAAWERGKARWEAEHPEARE